MESTSGDFWQMIVERDCRVIVMLCPLQEDGQVCIHVYMKQSMHKLHGFIFLTQEVCYQYWPCTNVKKYGDFAIKILNSTQCDGYIERILSVAGKVKVGIYHVI